MTLDALLSSPKYYSAIIRSTGLLSGQEREERIRQLLGANVWLAARCKNTCVLEEESILDAILIQCASLYEKQQDALAIVALLELGEVGVICYIAELSDNIVMPLYKDPNQSVSHLFSQLGEMLPPDLFWAVYHRIEELGYPLDIDLYNLAIARLPKEGDVGSILDGMKSSGIQADARTYYYLLTKATDYKEALAYYTLFEDSSTDDFGLKCGALERIIDLAPSREIVKELYQASGLSGESSMEKKALVACHSRLITLSSSTQECIESLETIKELIATSRKKSSLFGRVIPTYCEKLRSALVLDASFFKTFSLFCEITNIVCPEGFFKYKSSASTSKQLIESALQRLIARISSPHLVFELFQIMRTNKLAVYPDVVWAAVEIADSKEYLQRLLTLYDIGHPDPRRVVNCFGRFSCKMSDYLYHYLSSRDYPMNVFIFNTLIRKGPFGRAIFYLSEMKRYEVLPDILTIQSLMRKFTNKEELLQIISIADEYQVIPDAKVFYTIRQKAEADAAIRKIVLSIDYEDIESIGISNMWERFLADVHIVITKAGYEEDKF